MELDPSIRQYYDRGEEAERLFAEHGSLERLRTQALLGRMLPPPPATVLDVGGAAGVYALPLAARGYAVHLLDPVPLHVEQARAASAASDAALAGAALGDARDLPYNDAGADAVLLLGPLYHLTEGSERHQALTEARRVLRPGGVLVAAAISRWAPLFDSLRRRRLADPEVADLWSRAATDGMWRSVGRAGLFTTAYFHRPDELREEVLTAGFESVEVLGVEGVGWLLDDVTERLADDEQRDSLLRAAEAVEAEPSVLGASSHLLAVGRCGRR